jgi:hypothetical protein
MYDVPHPNELHALRCCVMDVMNQLEAIKRQQEALHGLETKTARLETENKDLRRFVKVQANLEKKIDDLHRIVEVQANEIKRLQDARAMDAKVQANEIQRLQDARDMDATVQANEIKRLQDARAMDAKVQADEIKRLQDALDGQKTEMACLEEKTDDLHRFVMDQVKELCASIAASIVVSSRLEKKMLEARAKIWSAIIKIRKHLEKTAHGVKDRSSQGSVEVLAPQPRRPIATDALRSWMVEPNPTEALWPWVEKPPITAEERWPWAKEHPPSPKKPAASTSSAVLWLNMGNSDSP